MSRVKRLQLQRDNLDNNQDRSRDKDQEKNQEKDHEEDQEEVRQRSKLSQVSRETKVKPTAKN